MDDYGLYLKIAGYAAAGLFALTLLYGFLKQPDFNIVPRRKRFRQVAVPGLIVAEVMEGLRHPPRQYQIYQYDADRGLIVYSDGPGLFSLGAFYPIYVDPSQMGVLITLAIEPRTPIVGPWATQRLRRLQRVVIQLVGGGPI
ncbi:hypothetical protein [Zavarzinia compransoris]|uniref:Uncharacterized protein n=1 Tax=Zavarzinia compransoris TaxID=1264899 RepID=A0A317EE09_9PROT|nr:hypothetical protein [Zavarzinia compransoris]PWR23583.1 hypothetical protein DKG75_03170 [Zavarzinia compransoris]TDP47800.1 hypothetical protein DES42_10296 [Zavarzinia compransoris]